MAYIRKNKTALSAAILERSQKSIDYATSVIFQSTLAPYVSAIYLYGSCARNMQRYSSDVDIFLELEKECDAELFHNEIINLIASVSPPDAMLPEVDLRVEIGETWKSDGSVFHKQILKEGRLLWGGQKIQQVT